MDKYTSTIGFIVKDYNISNMVIYCDSTYINSKVLNKILKSNNSITKSLIINVEPLKNSNWLNMFENYKNALGIIFIISEKFTKYRLNFAKLRLKCRRSNYVVIIASSKHFMLIRFRKMLTNIRMTNALILFDGRFLKLESFLSENGLTEIDFKDLKTENFKMMKGYHLGKLNFLDIYNYRTFPLVFKDSENKYTGIFGIFNKEFINFMNNKFDKIGNGGNISSIVQFKQSMLPHNKFNLLYMQPLISARHCIMAPRVKLLATYIFSTSFYL